MNHFAAVLVAAVVGVTTLSGSSVATAATALKPCAVLTQTELESVLDQPAAEPTKPIGPEFCQWRLSETPNRAPGQVNTFVDRGRSAKKNFSIASRIAEGQRVDGIGREARYIPSSGTLWVLERGPALFYVQVRIYGADRVPITDGLLDQLLELGAYAEARL